MGSRVFLAEAALFLVMLLLLGKPLHLPVALLVVTGSSMEPSLESGDLVIGVSPGLVGGVKIGEIVVYCLDAALRTGCIVHRVIDIHRVGNSLLVVTRGDALQRPDPPVPVSLISYVIVVRIPRIIWVFIVLLLLYVFYRKVLRRLWLLHRGVVFAEPGYIAFLLVAAYLSLNIAYIGMGYVDVTQFNVNLPRVREDVLFNLSSMEASIRVTYDKPLEPVGVPQCSIAGHAAKIIGMENSGNNDKGYLFYTVAMPRQVFLEEWRRLSSEHPPLGGYPAKVASLLFLQCRVRFNYALLKSSYPLSFAWREPLFRYIKGEEAVEIVNNNPVAINVTVAVYSVPSYRKLLVEKVLVKPFTVEKIHLSGHGRLLVRFIYDFLGSPRSYSLQTG